ncbi:hypothetical protein APHAL10511_003885 [Amanita phalloides]|nr:hypothetical protein APHAL10511_003885 [Amanita phalloides]
MNDSESEVEAQMMMIILDEHMFWRAWDAVLSSTKMGKEAVISTIESESDDTTEDFDVTLDESDILDHLPSSSDDSFHFHLLKPTRSTQFNLVVASDFGQGMGLDILADLDINLIRIDSLSRKSSDDIYIKFRSCCLQQVLLLKTSFSNAFGHFSQSPIHRISNVVKLIQALGSLSTPIKPLSKEEMGRQLQ